MFNNTCIQWRSNGDGGPGAENENGPLWGGGGGLARRRRENFMDVGVAKWGFEAYKKGDIMETRSPHPHFYKPQNVILPRRGDHFYELISKRCMQKKKLELNI